MILPRELFLARCRSRCGGNDRSSSPRLGEFPRHQGAEGAVEEAFELAAADRMLQLANGLGFDLPNAFAGHFEYSANFFERVSVTVTEAVTQLDDLALAVGERFQDLLDLFLEHFLIGRVGRGF